MIAYLAVVSFGAVIVPLDAQLTAKEVAVLLANSGAKAVFVSADSRQKLPRSEPLVIISFDPGDGIPFSRMVTSYPDARAPARACSQMTWQLSCIPQGQQAIPKG